MPDSNFNGKTHAAGTIYFSYNARVTADGDCSHEIKRHLFLGRKVMTNLDNIFESKDTKKKLFTE